MESLFAEAIQAYFQNINIPAEKKKAGVLHFTSKLKKLLEALEEKNEKQIIFLLHSVKPISAYLELGPLTTFLENIKTGYDIHPEETKGAMEYYIKLIESCLNNL